MIEQEWHHRNMHALPPVGLGVFYRDWDAAGI